MFFIPNISYYAASQDACLKCLAMPAIAFNVAIAAMTMIAVVPILLTPKK